MKQIIEELGLVSGEIPETMQKVIWVLALRKSSTKSSIIKDSNLCGRTVSKYLNYLVTYNLVKPYKLRGNSIAFSLNFNDELKKPSL